MLILKSMRKIETSRIQQKAISMGRNGQTSYSQFTPDKSMRTHYEHTYALMSSTYHPL